MASITKDNREVVLYDGRIYLPDSHHRHQAIANAVRTAKESPREHRRFDPGTRFSVELYFLTSEDEGNLFFDKNQRPRPTSLSKAFDLTTTDDLAVLAKRVIDRSENLIQGVNRVTDRLTKAAPHFMTLSTLRQMMRIYADTDTVAEAEMDGLATVAADFLDLLATVRPELRAGKRAIATGDTLASSGVIMHGYAALMRDYSLDVAKVGLHRAHDQWRTKLVKLSSDEVVTTDGWSGDFFDIENPVWRQSGITKANPNTGKLTVSSTGGSRSQAGRILRRYLAGEYVTLLDLAVA